MALSLGPLYKSIVSKVQNGKWLISIKTTAYWTTSIVLGFGQSFRYKAFQDEKDFLENHTNDHNISNVLAALFKKCIASVFSCAKNMKYDLTYMLQYYKRFWT